MPFITFDGTNGEEIASALTNSVFGGPAEEDHKSEITIDTAYAGPALVLDWWYYDGQRWPHAYHLPMGFVINTESGQVFQSTDLEHLSPVDISDLTAIA